MTLETHLLQVFISHGKKGEEKKRQRKEPLLPRPESLSHFEHIQQDDRPRADDPLLPHPLDQRLKARLVPLDHRARAEEAQDPRRRGEGAEHDGDSAVFVQMADGLDTGPGGVDVGGVVRIEDGKCRRGEAFGREVHMAAGERSGRGEEDRLLQRLGYLCGLASQFGAECGFLAGRGWAPNHADRRRWNRRILPWLLHQKKKEELK